MFKIPYLTSGKQKPNTEKYTESLSLSCKDCGMEFTEKQRLKKHWKEEEGKGLTSLMKLLEEMWIGTVNDIQSNADGPKIEDLPAKLRLLQQALPSATKDRNKRVLVVDDDSNIAYSIKIGMEYHDSYVMAHSLGAGS